jgi:outer membrane cobalamin receptor
MYQRVRLTWVNRIVLTQELELSVGADGRFEHGDSAGALDFPGLMLATDYQLDRDTAGGFVDLGWRPGSAMVLQASARLDKAEGFEREFTGRLGAKLPLADSGASVFANWGRGYKLPSFFALGNALVGNPQLRSEQAVSWDLGVEWLFAGQNLVRITGFHNDYTDLIDFDPGLFRNINRDQVITQGGELELEYSWSATLDVRVHATFTDIDVVDTARNLAGRPRWAAGIVAEWRFVPKWSLGVDYEFNDTVFESSRYSGEDIEQTLDAWQRLDATLRWEPRANIEFGVAVSNVLDTDYTQAVGFPSPGRWLRLQGSLNF